MSNTNITIRTANWQETLAKLPWSPKHAERSAHLALSKAEWMGIDKKQAIQQIFEVALGGFFLERPHIPYQTWQTVAEQLAAPERCQEAPMELETAVALTL